MKILILFLIPFLFSFSSGDDGDVFTTDGEGNFSWQAPSGGGSYLDFFHANDAHFGDDAASASSRNEHPVIKYEDSADKNVIFQGVLSTDYTGGDVNVHIDWVAETATSGNVVWGVEIERVNAGGHDIDSDSFDTIQTVIDGAPGTSGVVARATITLTNAEADGWAAGDTYRLRLTRDADNGSDTMSNDAQMLRVSLEQ